MKITIFVLHLGVGGVEKYSSTLSNMLCEEHEVEIISTYKMDEQPAFPIDPRIQITYLLAEKPNQAAFKEAIKKRNPLNIAKEGFHAFKTLYKRKHKNIQAIRACESDVIISTRIFHNELIGKYAKKDSIKITGEHNHPHGNQDYVKEVVASCRGFDYFIPISKALCDMYREGLEKQGTKCLYLPFCVDDHEPSSNASLTSNHLINVGRFSPEKGLLDLIEVFAQVHHILPDTVLDLVGDGNQKTEIIAAIAKHNLQDSVILHGYQPKEEVYRLYEQSACYVMTSYTESFGLVLLEAMSCGIGAFAFDSAEGACEIITNGADGFLIEQRDFSQMTDAIVAFLKDSLKRGEVSLCALAKAKEYSYDKTKETWLSFLREMPKKGSAS